MSGMTEPAGPVAIAAVVESAISVEECAAAVQGADRGAVVTFAGVVRNHDDGRGVERLSYSAHPGADAVLKAVAAEVAMADPGVRVAVLHRVGELAVGDVALACAVSSPHRAAAFTSCSTLVDEVKARVPIWKEQFFDDGSAEWVGALG
ncbi:molybdenum cofactor biosynthesis protein MoaE [Lysobacter korlensis]|uniref:Molybdopterin synthase catalytic subunit n=1 Tax=Lysobacter korlensis TaxID=553636 RepID=A0ABV6RZW2_9GAMM